MPSTKQNKESRQSCIYIRLPKYQLKGLEYLVNAGIHSTRSDAIRSSVESYLAFYQSQEGESLIGALAKLQSLAASRGRYETLGRWLEDITDMLEKSVGAGDDVLTREIIYTAKNAFAEMPRTYQEAFSKILSDNIVWSIGARSVDTDRFWLLDINQE